MSSVQHASRTAQMTFIRPFTLSFVEPILLLLNLCIALIYFVIYPWSESLPIVFIGIYHFSLGTQGLDFLRIDFNRCFGNVSSLFWYIHRHMELLFDEKGEIEPEYRLRPAFVSAFFIPICLFWFGWSARPSVR